MLGLAMVGAGRVSENHHSAISESADRLKLVGLYDRNEAVAAQRSEDWGVRTYESLDATLADPSIDAVLVLTHVDSHLDIARHVLAAGKHVFVEKPVGRDPEEISGVAAEAEARGLVVMPGHNYAYIPEFERMNRLTQNGDLGDIRALFITYVIQHPEEVARDYSGILEEVMIHHTYLAVSLLGMPRRVVAGAPTTGWMEHPEEDQAWMTLDYGSATVHAFASFAVDDMSNSPWTFIVKILGTRGTAALDWRTAIFNRPLGTLSTAIVPYEESYRNELLAFYEAIRGGGGIVSPFRDAAIAAKITLAANESRASGRFVTLAGS